MRDIGPVKKSGGGAQRDIRFSVNPHRRLITPSHPSERPFVRRKVCLTRREAVTRDAVQNS
jgi:hypothetical protein